MYKCVAIMSLVAVALAGCGDDAAETTSKDTNPGATTTNSASPSGSAGTATTPEAPAYNPWTTPSAPPSSGTAGSAGAPAGTADHSTDPGPSGTLSPAEESRSMPQAGQANDHSTTAGDKAK